MVKPTLSIFTGAQEFGRVFNEQNQINVKWTEFTLAFTDTTGNTAINAKGKIRLIILQGATDGVGFTGSTPEDRINSFLDDIEYWVQGTDKILKQQEKITYSDSLGRNYQVYCVDWLWKRTFSDPNRILFTLLMKQA